jgi:hypothetical protein
MQKEAAANRAATTTSARRPLSMHFKKGRDINKQGYVLGVKVDISRLKYPAKVLGVFLVLAFLLTRPGPKPSGYYTCSRNADCDSGICIRGRCRNATMACGDGLCETGENCTTCSADCGLCGALNGAECEVNTDCNSVHCVHGICQPEDPYPGDGWCDPPEDCWTAPEDCGECRWI